MIINKNDNDDNNRGDSSCSPDELFIYLSMNPSIPPSIHPSIHQSVYQSVYLSIYLSIYLMGKEGKRGRHTHTHTGRVGEALEFHDLSSQLFISGANRLDMGPGHARVLHRYGNACTGVDAGAQTRSDRNTEQANEQLTSQLYIYIYIYIYL